MPPKRHISKTALQNRWGSQIALIALQNRWGSQIALIWMVRGVVLFDFVVEGHIKFGSPYSKAFWWLWAILCLLGYSHRAAYIR